MPLFKFVKNEGKQKQPQHSQKIKRFKRSQDMAHFHPFPLSGADRLGRAHCV
jgi:hypothetical protein